MIKQDNRSSKLAKSKITHTNSPSTRNRRLVHLAGFPGYLCILISETTLFTIIGSFLLSFFTDKNSNLLELSSTQTLITPVISAGDNYGDIASIIIEFLVLSLLMVLGSWIILKGVRLSARLTNDVVVTYAPSQHQFILKSLLSVVSLIFACLFLLISYRASEGHVLLIGVTTSILALVSVSSFYLEHVLLKRYRMNLLSIWR